MFHRRSIGAIALKAGPRTARGPDASFPIMPGVGALRTVRLDQLFVRKFFSAPRILPPSGYVGAEARPASEGDAVKATQAMYWIIGRDNPRQPPALAVEMYNDNGEPIALHELATFKDPFVDACELAATQGVPADKVAHDEDSTDFFAQVHRAAVLPRVRRPAGRADRQTSGEIPRKFEGSRSR